MKAYKITYESGKVENVVGFMPKDVLGEMGVNCDNISNCQLCALYRVNCMPTIFWMIRG